MPLPGFPGGTAPPPPHLNTSAIAGACLVQLADSLWFSENFESFPLNTERFIPTFSAPLY